MATNVIEHVNNETFTLDSFSRANEKMIGTNSQAYSNYGTYFCERSFQKQYTLEEIYNIISRGSLAEQRSLSRNYFTQDGYYKHLVVYYATLLKYAGILIPNPAQGKSLSTPHIKKKYMAATQFVEDIQIRQLASYCALQALVEGCYYGVRIKSKDNTFVLMDLPIEYCRTNFKDSKGNDLIEFNVNYFDTLTDAVKRKQALKAYPEVITDYYYSYRKSLKSNNHMYNWFIIPGDVGVCFPFLDGKPYFLNTIFASEKYKYLEEAEDERRAEEVRKIIVQQIPHLEDGRLLFEPEEAAEMHHGTVQMLKHNKNVSVLTTYGNVDSIVSQAALEGGQESLKQSEHNIYSQAGVSGELFTSNGSNTLDASIENDVACMMFFADKFSTFVTNMVNDLFGNVNITFTYKILPISYYNAFDYASNAFKLASSGYSFLLPALAMDITQQELSNIKDLENDVLNLKEKLMPLTSSYTQSDSEGGRPQKKASEKDDRTLENEASKDRTAGGS